MDSKLRPFPLKATFLPELVPHLQRGKSLAPDLEDRTFGTLSRPLSVPFLIRTSANFKQKKQGRVCDTSGLRKDIKVGTKHGASKF